MENDKHVYIGPLPDFENFDRIPEGNVFVFYAGCYGCNIEGVRLDLHRRRGSRVCHDDIRFDFTDNSDAERARAD